jgi:hypothetical protein
MAYEKNVQTVTKRAGAALSVGRAVQINASNAAIVPTGQGARCFGIMMNSPASGELAEIATDGFVKAEVAAAVAAGQIPLTNNVDGRLETAAAADYIIAYSQGEAATAAGNFITVKIVHDGVL